MSISLVSNLRRWALSNQFKGGMICHLKRTPVTPSGEILLYQTEDGGTRIDVRLQGETVWLTQPQMAELFQTTKQNISLHVKNLYEEGELEQKQQ